MSAPGPAGWAIWLTGLPGSGKTTLARALQRRLAADGLAAAVLDLDALRPILAPEAGYGPAERDRVYARLVDMAGLLNQEGVNVIIAATGHRRAFREAARGALSPFAEVWVRCPIAVCERRDPKGLYAQVRAGAITALPGIHMPYEPPEAAEVTIDSDREPVEQAAGRIIGALPFLAKGRASE